MKKQKRDRKTVPLSKLNLARIEQLAKWSKHLLEEKEAKEKSLVKDIEELEKAQADNNRAQSRETPEFLRFITNTIVHYEEIIKMKNERIVEIKVTLHNYEEEMKSLFSSSNIKLK